MTASNSTTVIRTQQMVFSHLFYEGRFVVPWHQRRCDWTKEHLRKNLSTIRETA